MIRNFGFCMIFLVNLLSTASAEKNASLDPLIATLGEPTIKESFDSALPERFVVAKGQWKV
ncbi:hypothetical protein Poly41_62160 [Novipirellula artificiosorum]|uniref:Uncharacterized protein n=1 Tax=Novipirellula artificiosorum TaxID=2528016 RepID=A0A5C6D6L3_9BACT|nr:hypothetical protein Poly41_62160 [Novipirellula artificiosorum]